MNKPIAMLLSLSLIAVGAFAATPVASAKTKRGPRGHTGPRGLRGLRGLQGVAGPQGPQGPRGEVGVAGSDGVGAARIDFRGDAGSALQVLYNAHGLELEAQCTNSGPGLFNTLRAKASADNGSLVSYTIGTFQNSADTNVSGFDPGPSTIAYTDQDFDAGSADTIFDQSPFAFVGGTVIDFAGADGSNVTVNALYSDQGTNNINAQPIADCVFAGTAVAA